MSHCRLTYHIVFGTKSRLRTIYEENERELYAYMYGIMKNAGAYVHRINGMPDHIHIVADIPQTIAVSDFIKILKRSSSAWLRDNPHFPMWGGWAEGYGAFTYSSNEVNNVVEYVRTQKEHHRTVSFREEFVNLLNKYGIEYDERYLP